MSGKGGWANPTAFPAHASSLYLPFISIHQPRHIHISIECSQRKAHPNAGKLYFITRAVGVIGRPSLRCACIDLNRLILRGNQDVFLNGWTGTIISELSPP